MTATKKFDKNVNKGKSLPKNTVSAGDYNIRTNVSRKRTNISAVESKNGYQNTAAIIKGMQLDQFAGEDAIDLTAVLRLTKGFRQELLQINDPSRAEIRDMVKIFYQLQKMRIAIAGQERSIDQQYSGNNIDNNTPILKWILVNVNNLEKDINKTLDVIVEKSEVGRWLTQINGIGPLLAANFLGYFDVTGKQYATQFISYAGLNDNNRPWLGSDKAGKIVDAVVGNSKTITDEMIEQIALETQWSYEYLRRNGVPKKSKSGNVTKLQLQKAAAKIPYNKELKTTMFKFASCIEKLSTPDSLYNNLYHQRKVYEMELNEAGAYKEQAEFILATKKFKENDTKHIYEQGMLPPNHIRMRALRWMEKIFICHLFEEMYRVEYGKKPPRYYIFEHGEGHHDYIEPEVPFTPVPEE